MLLSNKIREISVSLFFKNKNKYNLLKQEDVCHLTLK